MRHSARGTNGPLRGLARSPHGGGPLIAGGWEDSSLPQAFPARGEIHVWSVDLDVPPERVAQLERLLTAEEVERAWRHRLPDDRLRFVVARGSLRLILGACGGIAPQAIRFRSGEFGKPRIAAPESLEALRFSASASEDIAVVAVANSFEIGVDVERLREMPEADALAREILTADELQEFAAAAPAMRSRRFLENWVRREALAKASGRGLRDVRDDPESAWLLPPPRAEYVAAVACNSAFDRVGCRRLVA